MADQGSIPAVDTSSFARKDEMPTPATSTQHMIALEP